MTDILGAVNDFILEYARNDSDLPALTQAQIIRGWQNYGGLPPKTQELAILTLLSVSRRGTNARTRRDANAATGIIETVSRLAEHMVQIDFCCARPRTPEYAARTRAEIMEILSRDPIGVAFFQKYGLSSCYADEIKALPFVNESKQWVARYSVTLHLTGWTRVETTLDSFTNVTLQIENVDGHHPVKKGD